VDAPAAAVDAAARHRRVVHRDRAVDTARAEHPDSHEHLGHPFAEARQVVERVGWDEVFAVRVAHRQREPCHSRQPVRHRLGQPVFRGDLEGAGRQRVLAAKDAISDSQLMVVGDRPPRPDQYQLPRKRRRQHVRVVCGLGVGDPEVVQPRSWPAAIRLLAPQRPIDRLGTWQTNILQDQAELA
jgi:hypothetical protein